MSQAVAPHIPLVRHLRDQLGWTQEELAARTDLSVRVVAKVEAGETISRRTAQAIASAFQKAGHSVTYADIVNNPASLALRFLSNYALHQGECVKHSLDILSPEIVALVAGDPATNPIAGEYRGIDEFDRFWKKFFGLFVRDGGTIDKPELVVVGDEVIARGYEQIRVPDVPPQKPGLVILRMRFKSGKMIRFEDYYEESGMMHALKQWTKEYPNADWIGLVRKEALESWSTDKC